MICLSLVAHRSHEQATATGRLAQLWAGAHTQVARLVEDWHLRRLRRLLLCTRLSRRVRAEEARLFWTPPLAQEHGGRALWDKQQEC